MLENIETIKKGTKLITNQLFGIPTRAIAMESIKQGRGLKQYLLCDVKGAEKGFYDECGIVPVSNIIAIVEED